MDIDSVEPKIQEIIALFALILKADVSTAKLQRKKEVVFRKFYTELDYFIDKLEEIYYKYYIKKRPIKKLETEVERDIAVARNTMNAFLPYMLMYNMNMATIN